MSTLYPRLLPNETEKLFNAMRGKTPEALRESAQSASGHAVFAATGGTRVTRDELRVLAAELEKIAVAYGYPNSGDVIEFDRAAARHLHQHTGMTPGEASQRQVWAFLALVLVPHICAWRFPMKSDGTYAVDRFKGSDLTRHTLGRLWTRAYVLHDPASASPYGLLDELGEADLDQIMARRRALAATPSLVRAVVRAHAEDRDNGEVPARAVLRDSLQRILRLTAFLDLDWMPEDHLLELVREQRVESRKNLAVA
ncbi:DUF6339 family protein [Paractinoplanes brasiliensis]|uniref:Uncharacterized protein n=1 Tax=Paractinoplanes brasiliensis TaxID=52695 RepID=A0A4R6JWZ4_9ACTN|nr:DUF6339 family protein [Actinoplanes brasiliensis]TDO39736.1 hypothetical protein C8E87_3434 [Actinoplanes brasiliensis]GID28927.1 hypothetical protein Abr02nite_39100 [Actinoplanes brasiliensis]